MNVCKPNHLDLDKPEVWNLKAQMFMQTFFKKCSLLIHLCKSAENNDHRMTRLNDTAKSRSSPYLPVPMEKWFALRDKLKEHLKVA